MDFNSSLKIAATGLHAQTARMDIHQLVRELNAALGPTLVATLSGSKDRKLPIKWAKADGPTPSPTFQARLQAAHRAWSMISSGEGEHVARAWFIGGNPTLGESTPISAIRDDRRAELSRAVTVFLRGDADE